MIFEYQSVAACLISCLMYLDPFHVHLDPFHLYKLVSILIGQIVSLLLLILASELNK